MEDKRHPSGDEEPHGRKRGRRRHLSPSSQIGRMQQTGGTPESRRSDGPTQPPDSDTWRAPREEDSPVEQVKPRKDG